MAACVALTLPGAVRAQEAGTSQPPPLDPNATPLPATPSQPHFYVTPGFTVPLSRHSASDESSENRGGSSPAGFLNLRWAPSEGWFANVNLYAYTDGRKPWEPDFTYSFGYDNWRPNTFSLVYANYTNSRFNPHDGDAVTRLEYGRISAGYKFQLPEPLRSPFDAENDGRIGCRVGYHYTPRYEMPTGPDRHNQQAASLGCRVPVWRQFFVDATAYDYISGDQRPWDPDYTYSFGWFDWRPNHFSVQYTNYSGTRFPWRDGTSRGARFNDGAISVTYNLAF